MCGKKVFLGMSGGVDSAVSAQILKDAGYEVIGVYMKNWSKDLPGMKCPWAEDLADAKRVAVQLDLDFRVFDFEQEYKQKVVDYMLAEYQKGNTPNPDIMCNQEIKFKLFAEVAFEQGADLIATGHYARTDGANLLKAVDENKDQTYFLYRIDEEVLAKTLFPVGGMMKVEVKQRAAELEFAVAGKSESMGVCFVGEANIKDFLAEFVEQRSGEIREVETDRLLGMHDGAIYYTLGQRHGLNLTIGLPYYVVRKDMEKNIVYVSQDLNNEELWKDEVGLRDVILRGYFGENTLDVEVRVRHRAVLVSAKLNRATEVLEFAEKQKALAPGQSVVFYQGDKCIGGGIVE
ncbi:MAG: tRNA 2-thiouridine(34) synthase MnmA [Candidatus Nomurabacteria bacterium]|jgi:tRNA-specific 2-thiouridylase|nr:tRNA 2-thiouridine(34) synthase MnmA [Candidatus Nomurabacteria bacterium]